VFHRLRFHLYHVTRHPAAFHLEEAGGVARAHQLEGLRVVERDVPQVEFLTVTFVDQVAGFRHDGERDESEEVHFQHAERGEDAHLELGDGLDGRLFGVGGGTVQREIFGQRFVADDHARGVRAGVAHRPFHFRGDVDQLAHLRVGIVDLLEIGDGQRVGHGGVASRNERDEFGDLVHRAEFDAFDARHVAQRGFRPHCAEGDDLRHFVVAVFAGAIFEHLGAAVVAEVEINVGHFAAARVEEALEEQVMRQRVHEGDVERVGHDGSRRGAARVVPDVRLAGVTAQVPDDEEVGVESHFVDDAQLVFESFANPRVG
jgi:hypothetical protein